MKLRSFKMSVGVATAALALTMAATSTAQAAPARAALSTAGPFDTYHSCRQVMNEYNRYYEIDSDCFQYTPIFGAYWFYYH
jgi:hypothetical protein